MIQIQLFVHPKYNLFENMIRAIYQNLRNYLLKLSASLLKKFNICAKKIILN